MPSSVADVPTTATAVTASSSNGAVMVNNVPRRANKALGSSPGGILCRVRIFALGSYTNNNNNNNNNNRDDQTIELDLESYRTSSHDEDDTIHIGDNLENASVAETVVPTVSSDITEDNEQQHVDETLSIESSAAAVPVARTPTVAASTHKVAAAAAAATATAAAAAAAAAATTTKTKSMSTPTVAASNNKVAMPSPKTSCRSPSRCKTTRAAFHNNNHKNAVPLPIDDNTESSALRSILDTLSEEQIEGAALASYQYYQLQLQLQKQPQQSASQQSASRSHYALLMIRRHWIAEKENIAKTLHKVQQSLLFRKNWKVNETRQTFSDNDDTPVAVRRRRQRNLTSFLGQKTQSGGRLFVRGFDRQGHACIHYIFQRPAAAHTASTIAPNSSSNSSANQFDAHHLYHQLQQSQNSLECMLAFLYILEKAIACTESYKNSSTSATPSTDGMITVSVDLKGFSKAHVPPTDALQQILIILRDHYPERLYRVYFFDAPLVFRYFWAALVKPRIDAATKEKFQFVTGRLARNRIVRPTNNQGFDVNQCMLYQHGQGRLVEPVDMKAFLHELPFDKAYDG